MVRHRDEQLLQALFDVEQALCRAADLTIACAEEDIRDFQETYDLPDFRPCLLPNGIDAENTPFLTLAERRRYKQRLGITGDVAIFIGSGHQPNVDAVQEILRLAGELPEVHFVIIGSVAAAFLPSTADSGAPRPALPANVAFTGVISEEEKGVYLRLADIALNPMRIGSGSNLKLAEYLAAGIPVVTTPVGARGYRLEEAEVMNVAEVADFAGQVAATLARREDAPLLRARAHILGSYDWDAIMLRYPLSEQISQINA
jgi:glycosyltransferase involved in cell wall biosynthesis